MKKVIENRNSYCVYPQTLCLLVAHMPKEEAEELDLIEEDKEWPLPNLPQLFKRIETILQQLQ